MNEIKKLEMETILGSAGICGEKAPFKDSNGDCLYTGDVVIVFGKSGIRYGTESIIKDASIDKIFVMGIEASCPDYKNKGYKIYKEKSYMSMKDGDYVDGVTYKNESIKKMTKDEIEKELGYKIEVIESH